MPAANDTPASFSTISRLPDELRVLGMRLDRIRSASGSSGRGSAEWSLGGKRPAPASIVGGRMGELYGASTHSDDLTDRRCGNPQRNMPGMIMDLYESIISSGLSI